MARNTPPTLVSYTDVTWTTGGSSKSSASVSWNAGDFIEVIGGCEGFSTTLGVPTATGLTFTSRALNANANVCTTRGATAVAAAGGSSAISMTNTNATAHWGFAVYVWRGSDGFDAVAEQHTATKTVGLTHTDTHSGVGWAIFDFAAGAITGISATPAPTHTRQAAQNSTNYSFYVADLVDQTASGSVSYGITGGSGTGPFSIVAIAALGTTTGGSTPDPDVIMAPLYAYDAD